MIGRILNIVFVMVLSGCAADRAESKADTPPSSNAHDWERSEAEALDILESRAGESKSSWRTCYGKAPEARVLIAAYSKSGRELEKWAVPICRWSDTDQATQSMITDMTRGQLENEQGQRGSSSSMITVGVERRYGAVVSVSYFWSLGVEKYDIDAAVPVVWFVESEHRTRDGYRIAVTFEELNNLRNRSPATAVED